MQNTNLKDSFRALYNYHCGDFICNVEDSILYDQEKQNLYSFEVNGDSNSLDIVEIKLIKSMSNMENDLVYAKFNFKNGSAIFNIVQNGDLIIEQYEKIKRDGFFILQVYGYKNVIDLLKEEGISFTEELDLDNKLGLMIDFGKTFVVDDTFKVAYSDDIIADDCYFDVEKPEILNYSEIKNYDSICTYLRIIADDLLNDNDCKSLLKK